MPTRSSASVVARREQLERVDRGREAAVQRAAQRSRQLGPRSLEDQDRLPDERAVAGARGIDIALARELGMTTDEPAAQEAGDVEFLPVCEIIAHGDGEFGIEAHARDFAPDPKDPS